MGIEVLIRSEPMLHMLSKMRHRAFQKHDSGDLCFSEPADAVLITLMLKLRKPEVYIWYSIGKFKFKF